ncbi:MAG: hypothetical protein ACR2FY_02160 [Pirellulaceae bacterium]
MSACLAVITAIAAVDPSPVSAQQRPKRSGYGTSRVAARPDSKEAAAAPVGRAGEGEQLPAPLTAEERDGNKLVALAAKDVFRQKAIHAKVRQRVFAFGQEVVGAGEYYQFGSGQPKLLRLDMKMQVGPQAATLLQVCGRQDYWIRRHVPPAIPQMEHVNLTRLASALSRADDDGKYLATDHWILLGGLSRLIESLHRDFDFAPPQPARIGTLPVLVVQGRLKPARFQALHPAAKTGGEATGEQLPTSVNVTLGRANQMPPHFPHRIEYLRQLSAKELKTAAPMDPSKANHPANETILSTLEFTEVDAPLDLDPHLFEFDPGDEEFEDRTQTWLRKLQE